MSKAKFIDSLANVFVTKPDTRYSDVETIFNVIHFSVIDEIIKKNYSFSSKDSEESGVGVQNFLIANGFKGLRYGSNKFLFKGLDTESAAMVKLSSYEGLVSMQITGGSDIVKNLFDEIKDKFPNTGVKVSTARYSENLDRTIETNYIFEDASTIPHKSFYPWLSEPVDEYYKRFIESRQNVLLLIGPPGTGKSTFIRDFIIKTNSCALIAYDSMVIKNPELINIFTNRNFDAMVLEDADDFIGARENGNGLMSNFLNTAEGIVQHKRKLIFSTNLEDLKLVDPALLRPGRCFDVLQFDLLTQEQAKDVIVSVGLPARDFSEKKFWSLAEVLNDEENFLHTNKRTNLCKKNTVGFM